MRPLLDRTLQILLKLSLLRAVAASDCPVTSPLGMESGVIEDSQISAFSFRTGNEPHNARLNGDNEWRANVDNQNQWLQIDLRKANMLTGIQTQGHRTGRDRYVKSYVVSYSDDGATWTEFTENSGQTQVFEGNSDTDSIRENTFNSPIIARFISIKPRTWNSCNAGRCIAMRIELLGCEFTATTEPTTVSITSTVKTTSSQSTSTVRTTRSALTSTSTNGLSASTIQALSETPQASVTTTVVLNRTEGDDGNLAMLHGSGFPTGIIVGASVGGVIFIMAITVAVVFIIRRRARGRNGSQKKPTNNEGEGTVDNVIYDSATFSANETGGGVSFGQSDGFVENDLYAGVGDYPARDVQNQTPQKSDQDRLYANVNNSQDEGFVDNDLYGSL